MMRRPLDEIRILGGYWGVGVSKEARAVVSIGVGITRGRIFAWASHGLGPRLRRSARAVQGHCSRGCLSGCQRRKASLRPELEHIDPTIPRQRISHRCVGRRCCDLARTPVKAAHLGLHAFVPLAELACQAQRASRVTGCDHALRNLPTNDCSCADHSTVADSGAWQHDRSRADIAIVADDDRANLCVSGQMLYRSVVGDDPGVMGDSYIGSDSDRPCEPWVDVNACRDKDRALHLQSFVAKLLEGLFATQAGKQPLPSRYLDDGHKCVRSHRRGAPYYGLTEAVLRSLSATRRARWPSRTVSP